MSNKIFHIDPNAYTDWIIALWHYWVDIHEKISLQTLPENKLAYLLYYVIKCTSYNHQIWTTSLNLNQFSLQLSSIIPNRKWKHINLKQAMGTCRKYTTTPCLVSLPPCKNWNMVLCSQLPIMNEKNALAKGDIEANIHRTNYEHKYGSVTWWDICLKQAKSCCLSVS